MINIPAGATSQTIDVFIPDSSSTTGAGRTGLAFNTAGLTCHYRKGATGTATAVTLATQTVGGAYSSGGFVEIDATNMPGMYRLDLPNAAIDTAGLVHLVLRGASNMPPVPVRINCANVPADVRAYNGTAGTFSGGRPEVNATHWGGTAVASATVRSDLINIAGAAVATGTAQLGVNVVNWGGTATGSANVRANIVQVAGQTASASAGVTFPASIGTSTLDAAGVWAAATRTLSSGANIVLAKGTGVTGFNDISAGDVWASGTRTLTAFGFSVTASSVTDKTGYSLAAAGLDSVTVETGLNARQALSIIAASAAGTLSGAATTTITIDGAGVSTDRIVATVDSNGNRTAVTLSPPA